MLKYALSHGRGRNPGRAFPSLLYAIVKERFIFNQSLISWRNFVAAFF